MRCDTSDRQTDWGPLSKPLSNSHGGPWRPVAARGVWEEDARKGRCGFCLEAGRCRNGGSKQRLGEGAREFNAAKDVVIALILPDASLCVLMHPHGVVDVVVLKNLAAGTLADFRYGRIIVSVRVCGWNATSARSARCGLHTERKGHVCASAPCGISHVSKRVRRN